MGNKAKVQNDEKEILLLRKEAERILSKNLARDGSRKNGKGSRTLSDLLHELQVYQVELEMQNEELRVSQVELEKEKARAAGLFSLAPVGFFVLDDVSVIRECNEVARLMLGPADLVGKRFPSFLSADSSDPFYIFIRKLTSGHGIISCQLRLKGKFNRIDADVYGAYIGGGSSKPVFYISVTDVTEKRLAEVQQQQVQQRLQMCLEASSAGTWQIDLKSGAVLLDQFAAAICGFGVTFDGRYVSFLDRIDVSQRTAFDDSLKIAIIQASAFYHTCVINLPDGRKRDIEVRGQANVQEGEKVVFLGLITDITARKKLEAEADQLKLHQQKEIVKTIIATEERERMRISTALHDSVGQLLYASTLKLHSAQENVSQFPEALKLLNLAIKETRNISFELAPSVLTDFGLAVALPEMIKRIEDPSLHIQTNFSGLTKRLPLTVEIFIFRIVQELLNNVIRHAEATDVTLTVKYAKGTMLLKMRDNGIGFDATAVPAGGTGLPSIRNRIALYNGSMRIKSRKNRGCTVEVQLHHVDQSPPSDA
jgi:signal transduction histidine kinase